MARDNNYRRGGNRYGNNRNDRNRPPVNLPDFQSAWIKVENGFVLAAIDFAEKWGMHLANQDLSTSQIRLVHGEIKNLQQRLENARLDAELDPVTRQQFVLLRPKVAYSAARSGSRGSVDFKKIMDQAHTAVLEVPNEKAPFTWAFYNFAALFEAIIAYHKVKMRPDREKNNLPNFEAKWIIADNQFEKETIDFAERWGAHLAKNNLSNAQIRNVFGEVKRLEAEMENPKQETAFLRSFLLLRPKIAYAAARSGSRGILDFKNTMDDMHTSVWQSADRKVAFRNFSKLFEAMLAYHKVYGTLPTGSL